MKRQQTTIAKAFEDAGFQPPSDRLRDAVRQARAASPRNMDGAVDALFAAVAGDAELLWEMFQPYRQRRALELFREIGPDERAGKGDGGVGAHNERASPHARPTESAAGHSHDDTHVGDAGGAPYRLGRGQNGDDAQRRDVPAKPPPILHRPARVPPNVTAIIGPLQREKIDGKPLGECTVGEVKAFAKRLGFRAQWLERLVQNLADTALVKEWRSDDDVHQAMKTAHEEAATK